MDGKTTRQTSTPGGGRAMKSRLLRGLSLAAFIALVGCQTAQNGQYNPSEIEKKFYKECAMNPAQPPCGHY